MARLPWALISGTKGQLKFCAVGTLLVRYALFNYQFMCSRCFFVVVIIVVVVVLLERQ